MENILCRDRFLPDAAFSECEIFGNAPIEMVCNHHHVECLFQRIHGIRARRTGRSWHYVWRTAYFNDVGRMSPTRALAVKRVDRPTFESRNRVFDKAAF